uniref:AC108 n=1 Tax=Ophiusa disjungens nucleopolyhedrovirus TaxID=521523 RepID=B3VCD1_9ABAC|nr:AC108 [Ophiusa disjungens nucleopolyhedrovirus]
MAVVNDDQLEQIVGRNQKFLRDFLMVVCCLIVFLIIVVFIMLVFVINKNLELARLAALDKQRRYIQNLDVRTRS